MVEPTARPPVTVVPVDTPPVADGPPVPACALPSPPSVSSVVDAAVGQMGALSFASSSSFSSSVDADSVPPPLSAAGAAAPDASHGTQEAAWARQGGALQAHPVFEGSPGSSRSSSCADLSEAAAWRPSQADVAAAATAPVLVAAHQGLAYQHISGHDPRNLPANSGSPIDFDTPLFAGRACVWLRGLPGAPAEVFEGRRRRTLVAVQGQFKRPVGVEELVTGQEFGRVENLPPGWLVEGVLMKLARALSPAASIGPLRAPHLLVPVAAGCSEICASRPGEEPDVAAPPREDLRLWDAGLADAHGAPLPAAKRKAHFSKAEHRRGRSFPTDLVFTFYFYQHVVDMAKYELDVLYRFNLCKYLAGQPLQLMMRDLASGQYVYCLHIWHKGLLGS